MKMKKIVALLAVVLMTGCSFIDSFMYMDEVDYYNAYIDQFNILAEDLDYAVSDYLYYVPEPETMNGTEDIYFYGAEYTTVMADLDYAYLVLFDDSMTIADTVKEETLEALAMDYFYEFEVFMDLYKEASDFYISDAYVTDLEGALAIETEMLDQYDVVLGLQFELSDLIEEYQIASRGELNEDSTDPVEKMGVSVTLLTDEASEIIDIMYLWDFENPASAEVKESYEWLAAKHIEEEAEVAALYDSYYDDLFIAFEEDYLMILTDFESEVAKFVADAEAGTVTLENSTDYDGAFVYYDYLINSHNAFVDLLNTYY